VKVSRFVTYWNNNPDKRAEILEARRARRAADPEFAELERKAAKERRERKKKPSKRRARGPARPKFLFHNNLRVELWSLGRARAYLELGKGTLSAWERGGRIPANHFRDEVGRRWWPRLYIEFLKPFVVARISREISAQEFVARVESAWQKATHIPRIAEVNHDRDHDRSRSHHRRPDHCPSDPHGEDRR